MIVPLSQLGRQAEGLNHRSRGRQARLRPRNGMSIMHSRPVRALQFPFSGVPRLPKPIEAYPRHSSRLGIDEKNLAKPKVAWRPSERARASPLKAKIKNHFPFGPAARACRVEVPPCGTKTGRLRTPLVTFGRLRKPTEGVPPRGPANALPTVTFPRLLALISSKHAQFQY